MWADLVGVSGERLWPTPASHLHRATTSGTPATPLLPHDYEGGYVIPNYDDSECPEPPAHHSCIPGPTSISPSLSGSGYSQPHCLCHPLQPACPSSDIHFQAGSSWLLNLALPHCPRFWPILLSSVEASLSGPPELWSPYTPHLGTSFPSKLPPSSPSCTVPLDSIPFLILPMGSCEPGRELLGWGPGTSLRPSHQDSPPHSGLLLRPPRPQKPDTGLETNEEKEELSEWTDCPHPGPAPSAG